VFDVRLRLINDDGTPGRVLGTVQHSWTGVGARQLRFTVPASDKLAAPFLVAVEYSTGGAYVRPRDDLFIVDEDSADSIDLSGAVSFTAQNVFGWLAARYPLWWRPGDTADLQRTYTAKTSGAVLLDLITHAKADQGWGPRVTTAFSAALDSAGNAWAETVTQSWPLFTTPLSRVVDGLTSQGYCEVWAEGFTLHAVNAGTGEDRTDTVTFGGPGFSRAPAKRVFDEATAIVVQHDTGWTHFDNPGAETRFGSLFKVMSQSGAPDRAAAEKSAQPALAEARAMTEELSYEWTVAGNLPRPWVDFQIGDLTTARTRQGKKLLRVVGMDVTKDAKGTITARVVVGSKILDFDAKLAKRAASVSVGTIIGGSGATPPPTPTPAQSAPVPPEGLHVESNTGSWRADGTAVSTVQVDWLAVTQNVDGMGVDVDVYELWARRASEAPALAVQTAATSAVVDSWEPGVPVYLTVRARSRAGVWSGFSPEIAVTPAIPASIVPKAPTNLQLVVNIGSWGESGRAIGAVYVQWDRVTESLDGQPVTIAEYEALDVSTYERLQVFDIDPASAPYALGVFPSKSMAQVAVRALTNMGVWSDFAVLDPPVEVASPTLSVISPSALVTSTGLGGASGRWDGKLAGGVEASTVPGFASVQVETATAAAGPWSPAGARLARAGTVSVQSQTGATVFFRATAYDTLGRAMGTSTVTSVVVQGVSLNDIPGLEGDLDDIRFTADGKNRVYMSATEPVGDTPTAVKRRNAALNPQQVAAGSSVEAQGRYSWAKTTTTGITGHPLGITTASRVTLTAASQTGAGRGFDWYGNSDIAAPSGSGTWLSAPAVTPGQTFEMSAWARSNRAGVPFTIGVRFFDHVALTWKSAVVYAASVVSTANGWAELKLTTVVPAGATRAVMRGVSNRDSVAFVQNDWMEQTGIMIGSGTYLDGRTAPKPGLGYKWEALPDASASVEVESAFSPGDLWLQLDPAGESIISILVWNGIAWAPQVLYADSIIAAESITSQLVRAGAIEVNHVSPSFGDSLNLQGNGSINLLAGRADAAAEQLTSQQAALDQQSAQVAAAQAAADAAASGASAAGIAAAAAQAQAAAAQAGVDNLSLAVQITPTDVRISRPGAPVALHLSNDQASFRRNGVAQTWWDETQMIVPKLKASQVIVGQTVITEGAGRTTWQRL